MNQTPREWASALQVGGTTLGELALGATALNNQAAVAAQQGLISGVHRMGGHGLRFAASPHALTAMKIAAPVAAVGGVMGVADVLAGQDSAANKIMDGTAMTIGGILGAPGGPVGIAAGAGIGKSLSDATQWLFGDKKTAEQRRMEEALAALSARGLA